MNRRQLLLIAGLLGVLAVFFAFDLGRLLTLEHLKAQQLQLDAYRESNPLLTALVFFAVYVAVTGLSFPGAAVMTLAAGAIFGLVWGTLLVSFASTIGASLAFLASRYLLRSAVQARFGDRLATVDQGIKREGAFYLFTLRLVPIVPFFAINLLSGLTAIPLRTFYWVSQLGMLAGTIVYVNAGTQLAAIESVSDIVSAPLLLSFALLGTFPWIARAVVGWIHSRKVFRGWQRPTHFDRNLVVIGGGSAGLVSAYIAAAVKAKVTLIERHRMGGDCLNTGCVPSKALIRSARLAAEFGDAERFGISAGAVQTRFPEVMKRVHQVIRDIEPHDSIERYTALGVDVVEGSARLVTPWEVEITQKDGQVRRLTSRAFVIATGARPFVPPIPGLESAGYLTSDTLWGLDALPPRLLVLGGGPIGCELAQAFARLGSRVTQVEMAPRLMVREDPDVSAAVTARFAREGIEVLTGHQAVRVEMDGGAKWLVAEQGGKEVRLPFDQILVAVGRAARLEGFGLDTLGIETQRTIVTNELLQTRYPNIYAAGDVAGPYQFTHTAAHQAWYASVNALFDPFKTFKTDYSVIPWATFTDPEVARVGLNEEEAKAAGKAYEVTRYGIDDLDRAIADGEAEGFIKVLTVPGKDRILGVTIVGRHAGDLIAEYVLAMKHGIGLNKILGTIHIYPTMAEANKYVAGNWKRAHAPERLLEWVGRFHNWRLGRREA
ncbi:MAG: FAD-dependent oxidoreductase [Rhodocyclaceae bacterium]|nr:FAD-dependent oxidoreductase [Rhodocyclaceae bacterium]